MNKYKKGDQAKVYEFIVRHFLACCSRDAQGFETTATIEICNERVRKSLFFYKFSILNLSYSFWISPILKKFSANGLMITERNYLDVYPYDRWSDKVRKKYFLDIISKNKNFKSFKPN